MSVTRRIEPLLALLGNLRVGLGWLFGCSFSESGCFHELCGRRVHEGDMLEIRMPGRYEWFRKRRHGSARLYLSGDSAAGVWLQLTGQDVLRWPESGS